jgi:hypothetical protein
MSRFVLQPRYSGALITSTTIEPTMYDEHDDESFDEEISFYQCDEESNFYAAEQRLYWSTKIDSPPCLKLTPSVKTSSGDGSLVTANPCPAPCSFKVNLAPNGASRDISVYSAMFSCNICLIDTHLKGISSLPRHVLKTCIGHKLEQNNISKAPLLPEL